ncbi:MAG TPA: TonB-dependent receptor [Candidatus Acidoferrales bacterium]|nr:TonB-dependent receptor [Candidatus Acidoferrales bacterium]
MKAIVLSTIIFLIPIQILKSQVLKTDTTKYEYLHEVVVSAPRIDLPLKATPFSVSLVDSEELGVLPRAVAIDEALKLVPGVKVDNQANGERVHLSIRGQGILTETGIRSIKFLLDGLPINDPTGFAPDLFDVDFDNVARIEVLRGPAASFYGGGAAGGIINIGTQNAPNSPLFGEVSTTGGSNNFWKGFGRFGGDVNEVNYDMSFSRTGGDGYRVHTHFWENNIYAKATYTPTSSFQVTPILEWSDTYHENPEGLSLAQYLQDPKLPNDDAVPYNEHMEMNRTTEGLTGVYRFLDNQEIRFNGYVKHSQYIEANNAVFDHQLLTTPGTSLQYTLTSSLPGGSSRNEFSIGTDLQWQTNNEYLDPNYHSIEGDTVLGRQRIWQWGTGVFLIDMVDLGSDWSFMGSVRYDKIHNELTDLLNPDSTSNSGKADFGNFTGRLGATYSLTRDLTFYGSWGQGFIPPSTEELDRNPNAYSGFNSDLVPATSNSFEIGARGIVAPVLTYDVTGFYLLTKNDFNRYRVPGRGNGEEGTFYNNVGASKRFGLELSATCEPAKALVIRLAYTYSHFKYDIASPIPILMDDTTIHKFIENGNWLPNSPQHQLMVDVNYEILPEVSIGLTSETLSKTYIDGANIESEAAAGYTLLGGRIVYRWRAEGLTGDLMVDARNVTDKTYVAFTEPDTGGNSYQPGAGREFFVTVKILL